MILYRPGDRGLINHENTQAIGRGFAFGFVPIILFLLENALHLL